MEIQFEQNRDFNQSHREGNQQTNRKSGEPQGREGDPNQRLVKREELDTDEKVLDRRPADVQEEKANETGNEKSSAIAGVQDDQQNSTRGSSKPLGENAIQKTEIKSKESEENNGNE
ncbi:hypothetical protein [Pedobacter xixiisoli]|uniref:Uncharacterized protein n=1 Tax=Pedobacter xixiisoli TaxID=1476464 RepID=A0A285ZWV1_9SPHI|nr:hypothetical protein [Pedobacter xixiisoli]SOD14134.1 hypothetical protein SAMN06297358_1421 [Pedobacter xixiisoli]